MKNLMRFGESTTGYAYVANNPENAIDATGLTKGTPAQRKALAKARRAKYRKWSGRLRILSLALAVTSFAAGSASAILGQVYPGTSNMSVGSINLGQALQYGALSASVVGTAARFGSWRYEVKAKNATKEIKAATKEEKAENPLSPARVLEAEKQKVDKDGIVHLPPTVIPEH